MKKYLATTYIEFITERANAITYSYSEDEDDFIIKALYGDKPVGSITLTVLYEPYNYEFYDLIDEDTYDKIFPESDVVKISHIEVNDGYKKMGIGAKLMSLGMDMMKDKGYTQFYLNACPMGTRGISLSLLVEFYKKFGFKVFLNQGKNILMAATDF